METNDNPQRCTSSKFKGRVWLYYDERTWKQCFVEVKELFPNRGNEDKYIDAQGRRLDERDLRSTQPNVTRSASRNSFVARSTVNNHDRLSRDDSPARRKTAKKLPRKLPSVAVTSKPPLKDKDVKCPDSSRGGSTESRRCTRSRDVSEDRKMSGSPDPSVLKPLTVSETFPRAKSVLSHRKQDTRKRSVSEQLTRKSKGETISLKPKDIGCGSKEENESREMFQGRKKRCATEDKSSVSESAEPHLKEMKEESEIAKHSYLRLSGRTRGTDSPVEEGREKRNKIEFDAYSSCKLKQVSSIGKSEQPEESNIDRDVRNSSMSIMKARSSRKRTVLSMTAESNTQKNSDPSVGPQISCLDKNANQSKGNPHSSDLTQVQANGRECNSKVSKKMPRVLSSSRQISTNITDSKVSGTRGHESRTVCASLKPDQEKESDILSCEPQGKLSVKQSPLGTTVDNLKTVKKISNNSTESSAKECRLEYETKERKSLNRELSNLSFRNPGRALADTLGVSLEASGQRMKRNVPKVSYLSGNSVEKPEGRKFKLSSVSRLRLWKEKQASLKRKTVSQRIPPFKKKQKITDHVPLILTVDATTSESSLLNVERLDDSERVEIIPASKIQRPTILRQLNSECATPIQFKRKRGRPPKRKSLIRRKNALYTEIRGSSIDVSLSDTKASCNEMVSGGQQTTSTETDSSPIANLSSTEKSCTMVSSAVDITHDASDIMSDTHVIDTMGFRDTGNTASSLTVAGNTETDTIDNHTSQSSFTQCVETDSSTTQAVKPCLDTVETNSPNSSMNQKEIPVSFSDATSQTELTLPRKISKKKRKRRSYKGCLDSSFKSKKKISKQAVNTTLPQERTPRVVTMVSTGQSDFKKHSSTLPDSPHPNYTVVEDSVHEEHSYAKNSPTSSHLRQISAEDCHADSFESPKHARNTTVFDNQEDCAPKMFEQPVRTGECSWDVPLQKPGILRSDPNEQENSPNNSVPSCVNPVPFVDSMAIENNCVQLEWGSTVPVSTDLACEILLIDHPTDVEIQQKESEGKHQLGMSAEESCSVSEISQSLNCSSVRSNTTSVSSDLKKDFVATEIEITSSVESLEKECNEIKSDHNSSQQSELQGKMENTDTGICEQDLAVIPHPNNDDSYKCSTAVVRYDDPKENASQGEKATQAQVLSVESGSNARSHEVLELPIRNLVPSETPEYITCRELKAGTDDEPHASLSDASLKRNISLDADTMLGSSGLSSVTNPHSTSPLSVLVGEWEDADAPPQLTPVLKNSTQRDELSTELTSPPILLASDSCLTPMSDSGLSSSEEVPNLSACKERNILPLLCTEDQTQSLESSTCSQERYLYPTMTTATEDSGNECTDDLGDGCIDEPSGVNQTSNITQLGNVDQAAEIKNSGHLSTQSESGEVSNLLGATTPEESSSVSMGETERADGRSVLIPFKRPRGRPRKSKGRKFKSAKTTIFPSETHKPKTKVREEKSVSRETADKQPVTVTRTFSLRPQVSRSPLENIALRFGGEEAYLSLKKRAKTSSATTPQTPSKTKLSGSSLQCRSLMLGESLGEHHCKPCSVVLTDFVKQLNLESIDSSDDSDSSEFCGSGDVNVMEDFFSEANTEEHANDTLDIYCQYGFGASDFKKKQTSPPSFLKEDTDQDSLATGILEMFANYKCKYCDYCSESSQLMEEHIYIHKEFFTAYPVCCSNCPRRFTDQNSFRYHHIQQHPREVEKCEVFEAIDEKDHYQIVLRDGSTIDLKMTDIVGNQTLPLEEENISEQSAFIQEHNLVSESKLNYPDENLALLAQPPLSSFNLSPQTHKCVVTTYSPDVEVQNVMQDILNEIEKCSKTTIKSHEFSPQHDNTSEGGDLNQPTELRCSSQVPDKSPSPITILLSKDGIAEPTDGQTEADSLDQPSASRFQIEEASPMGCEKSSDNLYETKAKVDPVVEKLRKIVRSNPPTIETSSSVNTRTPAPCDSRMPSVLLQTEQAGRKESSVLNTPSSTAPVIISVVVSGNVEVSTPDGNVAKQAPSTFICTYCTHGADDRSRMVEHVTQMHSDDTQYTCCICDKAFSSKMSVIHQHIKTNHPGQDQQKMCKPLPSFYALGELREHESVRTKTSDNIFEMFSPVGDTSSSSFEKDEPLRQHFRKARDVMLFREKAKRQAEADSTTSGTGEDVISSLGNVISSLGNVKTTAHIEIPRPGPSVPIQDAQQSFSPKSVSCEIQSSPNDAHGAEQEKVIKDPDVDKILQANYQNEDDSCAVTSSEKSAVADSYAGKQSVNRSHSDETEGDRDTAEDKSQGNSPIDDGASAENSDSQTMLKIVSVVSLSGMESSPIKDEAHDTLSNDDKDSGEITREAAQSAVSALFKKGAPSQTVIMDTRCSNCEEVLDSVEDLYYHLQNVHKLTCFYSCPVCSQHMRKSEQGVRQHLLTAHGISDESIQLYITSEKSTETATKDMAPSSVEPAGIRCNHCASSYSSAGSLLKHLESVHDEVCLLECPYCKKGISKEESEVYEHIKIEHKAYDAFVPLLLVSNRAPASSKSIPKQSLAISESRRQLFASKTMKASNLPLLEKQPVGEENSKNAKSAQAGNTSTASESIAENTSPNTPTTLDKSAKELSSIFSLKPQSTEPQTESTTSPPVLSPLAMLKKTTSSILNEVMSEAASVLRPTDSTVNTYTTVFNVQPTPSIAKRIVPIKPKPDAQPTTPVYLLNTPPQIFPLETGISVITKQVPRACQQEKLRPIVPRGIKHVEKRPLKNTGMHDQLTSAPRRAQTTGRDSTPSEQTEVQVSNIPPFEPATAMSSTVKRPLLRVPSLIPSAAGKPSLTRSVPGSASFTAHEQSQINQASVASNSPQTIVPKEKTVPVLSAEEEAPLDLSRPVLTPDNVEIEEELDPDAFNVFNLSPVKQIDSVAQPLNLSVKLPHAQGPQNSSPGFRSQVYSHLSETHSTHLPGTPSVSMARPGVANMPGSRPILGTRHILQMPGTVHTNIRMEAVGNQMVARYPTTFGQHRPQMDERYPNKSGVRMSAGGTQGNLPSGVSMIQRSYQGRPSVVPNVQSQIAPQSRPRVRHPYLATSVRSESRRPDLLTPSHAHKLVCPSCDFYTRSPAAMKAHITNVHKARYRCPYCPHLVPLTQRDVPYHMAQQHPDKKLMYFNI